MPIRTNHTTSEVHNKPSHKFENLFFTITFFLPIDVNKFLISARTAFLSNHLTVLPPASIAVNYCDTTYPAALENLAYELQRASLDGRIKLIELTEREEAKLDID